MALIKAKKENNLKQLKEEYEKVRVKYKLPDFKFMNENFEIENIDIYETELFLKMMRKHMTEKVFFILRTLEMFQNPQNAPVFIFEIIKGFGAHEKELIKDLSKKIARYEIDSFGLEAKYSEEKEADFIRKLSSDWKDISDDLDKIYSSMKEGHKRDEKKGSRGYLG